ncbi:MAG: hypothetical protein GY920_15995 [Aliivibrio sp.]|nr:hypothetical protein [Aliivibrio sp.]
MNNEEKKKVKDLLIATIYGVSASEMMTIIGVEQDIALNMIAQLKAEGEDIQSLGEGSNPEEFILYSIGEITP